MAIAPDDSLIADISRADWRDYLELTKPKVSLAIVFTAIVGMVLASPGMVPLKVLVFGTLGIALASGCAAALNHILDQRIDRQMARTRRRPLATGQLRTRQALRFAAVLGLSSMLVLWPTVGGLCALLTFGSLIGYAVIYTGWLKRATPQNIVIGGAAGAAPPLLGWVAVTHSIDSQALALFLIIFVWTPPHFWALAIARRDEYAKAGIPMLPVTHGVPYTRLQILRYTVLLTLCTLIPFAIGMSGFIYLTAALLLNARFLYFAVALYQGVRPDLPIRTFRFSITYLMALFGALIADHYIGLSFTH
jgi:heme o synthase